MIKSSRAFFRVLAALFGGLALFLVLPATLSLAGLNPDGSVADCSSPVADDSAPAADDSAPAAEDSAPVAEDSAPVIDGILCPTGTTGMGSCVTVPIASQSAPAAENSAPVADESAAVVCASTTTQVASSTPTMLLQVAAPGLNDVDPNGVEDVDVGLRAAESNPAQAQAATPVAKAPLGSYRERTHPAAPRGAGVRCLGRLPARGPSPARLPSRLSVGPGQSVAGPPV